MKSIEVFTHTVERVSLHQTVLTSFSRCFGSESEASATDVLVAKTKRQLQMSFVAKAKADSGRNYAEA